MLAVDDKRDRNVLSHMDVAASLRQLLARSIDYAGMFPPCSLALEPALQNQANYVRSTSAWMLNAFVLPVGQFTAAKAYLAEFDPMHPLRVAALGPKLEGASNFREILAQTMTLVRRFADHNIDLIEIAQLEMALPSPVDGEILKEAREITGDLPVFWETPPETAPLTINLLAEHNSDTAEHPFGYKLRTGGVTADAFPTSQQIARALVVPARNQVPIKFTAGLHHPVRQFRDEVKTKMHGFLNVLGAASLAAEHTWDERQTTEMLEDEAANSFSFEENYFGWREWKIDLDRLEARRRFVTSFGSCSFDEPREDLHDLGFL